MKQRLPENAPGPILPPHLHSAVKVCGCKSRFPKYAEFFSMPFAVNQPDQKGRALARCLAEAERKLCIANRFGQGGFNVSVMGTLSRSRDH